jgi:serine/threonine protein kinase
MTGTIVGTPAYMAPEQAELKPVSSCTDIYALGLLLYEMLTGVAAFAGDTPVAVALKQIRDYPKRPREIVPDLTRAMDAVVMKCLQKDPTNRFQSVDQFEMALSKAAKARRARPWEVALNRGIERAEVEIRTRSRQGAEMTMAFLKRQDWRSLLRIQEEPQAMLGVAGIVSALTVFMLFGAWKPRTINAQTVQIASQNQNSQSPPIAAVNGSVSNSRPFLSSTQDSLSPIASQEVDLYENFRTENAKAAAPAANLPNANLGSAKASASRASLDPSRIVKPVKSPVRTNERKAKLEAKSPAQSQALASPAQPENLATADATNSAAQELAANSSQPEAAPQPAVEPGNTVNQPKTDVDEAKTPQLYFEVGSFKDQTWANNAVDKLTQLGFHAVLIHKNLLWTQSYHVQVGPYTNQKDIAEARQSLSAQGYKAHPVN